MPSDILLHMYSIGSDVFFTFCIAEIVEFQKVEKPNKFHHNLLYVKPGLRYNANSTQNLNNCTSILAAMLSQGVVSIYLFEMLLFQKDVNLHTKINI